MGPWLVLLWGEVTATQNPTYDILMRHFFAGKQSAWLPYSFSRNMCQRLLTSSLVRRQNLHITPPSIQLKSVRLNILIAGICATWILALRPSH
jgi:hypothetical protein